LRTMESRSVVPDDQEEPNPQGTRRVLPWAVLVAAVVAAAVLFGTGPGDAPPETPRPSDPLPTFTTTTVVDDEWIPSWLPGTGDLVAAAETADGAVAVQRSSFDETVIWRERDGVWVREITLSGVAVDVAGSDLGVAAVGIMPGAGPGAAELAGRPTAWWSREGTWRPVALPGSEVGMAAAVTATTGGFVAVGWAGSVALDGYEADLLRPRGATSAVAWTSPDGAEWIPAEVEGAAPGAMLAVTDAGARLLAGGRMGGRARLWESTDGGRTWSLVEDTDTTWPAASSFVSVAALPGVTMAVAARVGDQPQSAMWREGERGWVPVDPQGIVDTLVARLDVVDGRLFAFATTGFERLGRVWISDDGDRWSAPSMGPPCPGGCGPFVPGAAARYRAAASTGSEVVIVGGAAGQPVLWAPVSPVHLAYPLGTDWRRLELDLRPGERIVGMSGDVAVVTGERGTVTLVDGERQPTTWGAAEADPWYTRRIDGTWWAVGWMPGGGVGVWAGEDAVSWRLVAASTEADRPPAILPGDGEVWVVGVGFEVVDPETPVRIFETGLEVQTATVLAGELVTAGFDLAGTPQLRIGDDPVELAEGTVPIFLDVLKGRLVVGALTGEATRILLLDADGSVVAEADPPLLPWQLGRVGELAVGLGEGRIWVSDDGREWTSLPVDVESGVTGPWIRIVPTGGDLVIQGFDRGLPTVWRWTGPLPATSAP